MPGTPPGELDAFRLDRLRRSLFCVSSMLARRAGQLAYICVQGAEDTLDLSQAAQAHIGVLQTLITSMEEMLNDSFRHNRFDLVDSQLRAVEQSANNEFGFHAFES